MFMLNGNHSRFVTPSVSCELMVSSDPSPAVADRPSALRNQVAGATRGDGQVGSDTHRPGTSPGQVWEAVRVSRYARAMGSSMIPVSTPVSQCDHQRTSSYTQSRPGPGSASCG